MHFLHRSYFTFNVLRISNDQLPNLLSDDMWHWQITLLNYCYCNIIPFCVWLHQGMFRIRIELKWKHKKHMWTLLDSVEFRQNHTHTNEEKSTNKSCCPFFKAYVLQQHKTKWLSFLVQKKRRKQNKIKLRRIYQIWDDFFLKKSQPCKITKCLMSKTYEHKCPCTPVIALKEFKWNHQKWAYSIYTYVCET